MYRVVAVVGIAFCSGALAGMVLPENRVGAAIAIVGLMISVVLWVNPKPRS